MKTYDYYLKEVGEVGYVKAVVNSMVYATGLPKARVWELVVSETGQRGIVQALLPESVEILMLDAHPVNHGTALARTNEILKIGVGDNLLGRSIDTFGNPIDGKEPFFSFEQERDLETPAMPIFRRAAIDEPFTTGVSMVDLMVPLGVGQRELVIGDQKAGKTTLLLQAIENQASLGTICIYVAIGKKKTRIKRNQEYFNKLKSANNIILVASDAAAPASFVYLAPFAGMTIAEYFRDQGKNVLIVFDDLNTHAKLYREIALLSKRTPGREAYPGDIFYLHSHLIERAGKVMLDNGKTAAITLLAAIETVGSDMTGYIQTNAMSMTDGHIFLDLELFQEGLRPAVNISQSVSRVGRQAQSQLDRQLSEKVSSILSDYRHATAFEQFGLELTEKTQAILETGQKLFQVFHQDQSDTLPHFLQSLFYGLLLYGFWQQTPKEHINIDKIALQIAYGQGKLAKQEKELLAAHDLAEFEQKIKQIEAGISAIVQPSQFRPEAKNN